MTHCRTQNTNKINYKIKQIIHLNIYFVQTEKEYFSRNSQFLFSWPMQELITSVHVVFFLNYVLSFVLLRQKVLTLSYMFQRPLLSHCCDVSYQLVFLEVAGVAGWLCDLSLWLRPSLPFLLEGRVPGDWEHKSSFISCYDVRALFSCFYGLLYQSFLFVAFRCNYCWVSPVHASRASSR